MTARLLAASRIAAASAAFASIGLLASWAISQSWVRPVESTPPMVLLAMATLACVTLMAHAQHGRPAAVARDVAAGLCALWAAVQLTMALVSAPPQDLDRLLGTPEQVATGATVLGRPAAETSLALLLLALAAFGVTRPRLTGRVGQPAAAAAAAVCAAALVGYSFGVDRTELPTSFRLFGMSPHTAVCGLLVAVAALLARPRVGVMAMLTESSQSGTLARRLVAVVVSLPVVVSVLTITATRWLGDRELVLSLIVVIEVALLGALLLIPLLALRRSDEVAAAAHDQAVRAKEALAEAEPLLGALGAYLAPSATSRGGLDVSLRSEAAFGTLSGDWCGLVDRDPDPADPDAHWVSFGLVDVAGHGSIAALFAARLKHQLVMSLRDGTSPADALARLEREFDQSEQIATAVVCSLDLRTGRALFASAGHLPAFVARRGQLTALHSTGPLLGAGVRSWEQQELTLHRGDVFVSYTDGLTEARDRARVEWGTASLADVVRARSAEGPAALSEAVMDAAMAHSGGRLNDDATVIVLARR